MTSGSAGTPCGPAVAAHLGHALTALHPGRRLRVAVDGVDGSGKTVFGSALAAQIRSSGRSAVSTTVDRFHRPAARRYARGRHSPIGFYRDSFDDEQLRSVLLDPFGPGGDGCYRAGVWDVGTDTPDVAPVHPSADDAVLVLDGVFLQRPPLRDVWDVVVFLHVPFAETYRRMAVRDGCPADPEHPANVRYRQGQQLYLEECSPAAHADVLLDNSDPRGPRLLRWPQRWG